MRPLGEFVHISGTGNIIFRGRDYPPLYAEVFTKSGKKIGKVVDITGKVSYPYFIVHPEVELKEDLVEEIKRSGLFVKPRRRQKIGKKVPRMR